MTRQLSMQRPNPWEPHSILETFCEKSTLLHQLCAGLGLFLNFVIIKNILDAAILVSLVVSAFSGA